MVLVIIAEEDAIEAKCVMYRLMHHTSKQFIHKITIEHVRPVSQAHGW